MTHIMFDSDDLAVFDNIYIAGATIATYADILTPAFLDAHKGNLRVIDRGHGDPLNVATIADVEDGALTPEQAAAKIKVWQADGRHGCTTYSDRSDLPAVEEACKGLSYYKWVATLDNTTLLVGQTTATQVFTATALGFHADMSIVWDENWFIYPAAAPPPNYNSIKTLVTNNANSILNSIKGL